MATLGVPLHHGSQIAVPSAHHTISTDSGSIVVHCSSYITPQLRNEAFQIGVVLNDHRRRQ